MLFNFSQYVVITSAGLINHGTAVCAAEGTTQTSVTPLKPNCAPTSSTQTAGALQSSSSSQSPPPCPHRHAAVQKLTPPGTPPGCTHGSGVLTTIYVGGENGK